MSQRFKKTILFLIFIGLPVLGFTQTSYQFAFDNVGNRIKREVIFLESFKQNESSKTLNGSGNKKVEQKNKSVKGETITAQPEITLYPNPTVGSVILHIAKNFDSGRLQVISSTGKVVFVTNQLESETEINLNNEAAGNYIVHLQLDNGEEQQWMVVKQ